MAIKMLLRRCVPEEHDSEPALIVFREYYKTHYNVYTSIYDGMKETLEELKSKGYLLAVISNKLDYISKDLINYYYPGIFDYIQGDTPTLTRKPDPDMFNHVLSELNINKEDALYIGDTNVDYEFATNANVDVILVTYGYRTKKEMDEYHYNVTTVQSPKELLNLL